MTTEKGNGSPDLPDAHRVEKYSVFNKAEKWCIVALVAYAAWFSTLSSFIYYPALSSLAQTLEVSVAKINLTVTNYMAVATLAPTLVGDAADVLGRRPVYLLALGIYVAANIAIALSESYPALLGFRALQALAISSTFSVAYGVITDLASPAERGSFVSAVSFAVTIAPSLGPILGGALNYGAGWPWIFWFLAIAAGACLTLMALLLPETSRQIVGNWSVKPARLSRLPWGPFVRHWEEEEEEEEEEDADAVVTRRRRLPNPLKSLVILGRKDNTVVIFACGPLYVVYTCLNASLSTLFIGIYKLNQWQSGIIYLPFGLGGTASTFFSGLLLNAAYRNARTQRGLSTDRAVGDDLDGFDVEKARLGVIWVPMLVTAGSVLAFGWVLHYETHIAIPLTLQFIAGLVMQLDFSIYNTLLVDKNHSAPAAAQASSKIVRCTLAAITVSFLQQLLDRLGIGWTFTLMAGLSVVALGCFVVDYNFGMAWRQQRTRAEATTVREVS